MTSISSSDVDACYSLPTKKPRLDPLIPDLQPVCIYGSRCYRVNPEHFATYSHPRTHPRVKLSNHTEDLTSKDASEHCLGYSLDQYGFYLFRVPRLNYGHIPTIRLKDIFHPRHGELVSSAQFNYMFDVDWLVEQYPKGFRSAPLLLVHGFQGAEKASFDQAISKYKNISQCVAHIRLPYGTHHTKMMLLKYTDGLRIVIHTANMIAEDWSLRTQGLWISPKLRRCEGMVAPDSETKFRADLITYLHAYGSRLTQYPNSPLGPWIKDLAAHDFSLVRVYLIGSVSGRYTGSNMKDFGHVKLGEVLRRNSIEKPSSWPIVGQFSSVGSLGAQPTNWFTTEWSTSLAGRGARGIRLIYPCVNDVRDSLEGYAAGGCLPFSKRTADKQLWLRQFLHRWRASGHTRAIPHIKTYARISPDGLHAAWFLLTSANLSKAAWGAYEKDRTQLMIRSYELGVLFLPFQFQNNATTFQVACPSTRTAELSLCGSLSFPLPYDLPLTPYESDDQPWLWDVEHKEPDVLGHTWRTR